MKIRNVDLDTAAGHSILYAMNNMQVRISTRKGVGIEGTLSVQAVHHPYVVINISKIRWEPIRISRTDVVAIDLVGEN